MLASEYCYPFLHNVLSCGLLRQRIIVFVGSPLGEGEDKDEGAMVRLAKKLKKNNIAIDIVCFGDGIEEDVGSGPLLIKTLVDGANSGDNS